MLTVRLRAVIAATAAAVLLGACGGSDEPAPEPTASTPAGFDLPTGVTLTKPGATLEPGTPANVIYQVGDGAASAITSTVRKITKGKISDFRFFTLDATSKASTPYYVVATVTNKGPAGLGGIGAPFMAHDDSNTVFPPNVVNGSFKPCAGGTLPKTFLPGRTARVCMVFLVPKGRRLVTIDAQSDDPGTAVRWKV